MQANQDRRNNYEDPANEDGRVIRARLQRRERREQILRAAENVFAAKGYHATSISDVIGAAGSSRGTFYLYFDSKRAIFDELLDDLFGKLKACVRPVDITSGAPSPVVQLRANVERAMDVVVQNQDLARILYRTVQGIDTEFDCKVSEFNEGVIELIRRALRKGMELGLVRSLDSRLVAHCIFGSVKEIVFHLLEDENPEELPLAKTVEEVLLHNLHGALKR